MCTVTHNGHVLLEMCLWNSTVVCRQSSFQQICRVIFWSLTQPNGCRFLAAKAVLSGVECGSELYCFLSQRLPPSLCITPTPHAMSGARPTLVVGSGFFIFRHAVTSRLKKGNKQRKYMYESVCEISVHNVPDTLMPTCRSVHINVNTRTVASVREKKREHVS